MTATRIGTSTAGGTTEIRLGTDGHIFLTAALCEELEAALTAARDDAGVRVLIVTGANPGVFMRHYSVAEILAMSENLRKMGVTPGDTVPYQKGPIDRCIDLVETLEKPVIAAINGECMGGAMEFSLGCDVRIAQRGEFRLGQPETVLGILPGAGGTQRLARTIGYSQAMNHALTGLPILPEEAHRIGLVHMLADDAIVAARARAQHFCAIPPMALAHTKRLVRESAALPLAQGLELERTLFLDLAVRDEGRALMTAYEAGRYRFACDGEVWRADIPPYV